ncbi:hypothetical protein F4814DRAFT_455190 [Daldinia grandis]|nr:hypothetical protein F4814DRAFT_455190 [Daldinia grandis]
MAIHGNKKVYTIDDDDELSSDAHSGQGEDYKAIERLSLADAKNRKHGEFLVASIWAGNIRRRLSEIEEIGLEELKAQKQREINKATEKADNIRWALIEVEDWGLAIREGLLPDGTPFRFSTYFIRNLKGAVEKAEAAMALAKIALKATLNISYLGQLSQMSLDLLGVPFTNLTNSYESIAKELQDLDKRTKMWREIVDNGGIPVDKGKMSAFIVDDDPTANPAGPFFEADGEARGILIQELQQTINSATTIDGKRVDSKAILDQYFSYLKQYHDNFYAAVGTPEEKKKNKVSSKEIAQRLAERHEKRLQAAREERVKRKVQQELNAKRQERTEMRKDILRKAQLDRKDLEERKRKRAVEGGENLRLGFHTPSAGNPPAKDGEPDTKRPRVESPKKPTPVTPVANENPEENEKPALPPTPPPTPPPGPAGPAGPAGPVRPVRPTPWQVPDWVKTVASGNKN